MARPNKQGVDYFPLDIHLDDKFKFIEIKYKLEGFAVLIKLMQRVYANGYWCKWTEDELWLFSDEIKADNELVQNVVTECLKREVFDQKLFDDYNILTSKGIQKRYKEMVRRRKDVEMYVEYLLIDGTFGVNDDINTSSSKQEDGKSTQSKVNKTKLNKTEKDIKEPKVPKPKKQVPKIQYAEFVHMKEDEYKKLVEEHGQDNVNEMVKVLDNYKGASGKTYKSDYRAILQWVIDRVKQPQKGGFKNAKNESSREFAEKNKFPF